VGENAHIRDRYGRRNSIVEVPHKWLGGLLSETRSILQVVNGQAAGQDQDAFLPNGRQNSKTHSEHRDERKKPPTHIYTHRSLAIALPRFQLLSGLNDPSIDACTIGTLRTSSPNMRRKGTKTPWSKPGPAKPRPSAPRTSSRVVKRARIPAYRRSRTMVLDKRRTGRGETGRREGEIQYLVEQFNYASGERRIASRAKLELV
jgi:hypothetical protein